LPRTKGALSATQRLLVASLWFLVAVVFRLVRTLYWDTQVLGLI